ncbi:MAG TPA: long-chain fatty acid--CoA ligase [Gemmatimonadaceae bacterium]|jgi:long-chain acyl-CoA synthetase|nr:long-chain fatty acid--CoA ligase [Gemmatimonadaceae bacterium]
MTQSRWLANYDEGVPHSLEPYPDRTLIDYLHEASAKWGDRPALLFKGASVSYRRLDKDSDAFASALHTLGVRAGDRVGICLPNCPQFLVAEFAAWKIGAIACPFNPTYTERETLDALHATGAETVIVLNRFYDKIKSVQPHTSVKRVVTTGIKDYLPLHLRIGYTLLKEVKDGERIGLRGGDARLSTLLRRHRWSRVPAPTIKPDDVSAILMSGGTTGTPKGVVGTHRGMVIAGIQLQAWLRSAMREWSDVIMMPLPLFHTYGNTGLQSLSLINHNPILLVPNPRDLRDLVEEIKEVRPHFLCTVPTLLNGIMNHPSARAGNIDFSSIKLCFSGAAALMAETKRRFEELTGGVIVEGYSLTEAQMAVIANPVRGPKKIGSIGMPLPDVRVRILDSDDGRTPKAVGEVGEIVINAPQMMRGYWNRPDETREMLRVDEDGVPSLYTGDLGYMDSDGYIFIVDRKKDLIKTSGYQVWPREIEEVLVSHPAVCEVGVVGLPDSMRGEVVKAFVVLRPGSKATAAELKTFCRDRLAPYKVPAKYEFVPELPKTQIGKVLHRVLRQAEDKSHDPDLAATTSVSS